MAMLACSLGSSGKYQLFRAIVQRVMKCCAAVAVRPAMWRTGVGARPRRDSNPDLAAALEKAGPDALAAAIASEGRRRFGRLLDGIKTYHRHPYRRQLPTPPTL